MAKVPYASAVGSMMYAMVCARPDIAQSIERFLNDFANQPNETNTNDLESDKESIDTPLVSPFPYSDNDSDNDEVLNELIEYENVGMLHREKEINSFDGDNLAFQCMIGFRKFTAYFDPFLPMNIITQKAYNTIMVEELKSRKAHLLEDKQIPSVWVFDEVLSTWMTFGGYTCDLGSFGEETDKITDLHQILEEVLLTERRDGVASIKRRRRDLFSDGNVNPLPTNNRLVLPAALCARAVQELHKLQRISAFVDSCLESIDRLFNDFAIQPNETNMNDLESDEESVDTPLISPFPHSDNDSDAGEVINELIEYENVGMLRREKAINSCDGDNLAFQCMIGFRKFTAYFDPFLPTNIITQKAYNIIMVEELKRPEYQLDESMNEWLIQGHVSIHKVTKFLIKNEEEIFTDAGDDVRIYPDGSIFYLVPGLDFHLGLKPIKYDTDFDSFVQCGVNHGHDLHVYSSSFEFDLNEQNNDSGSELDDDDDDYNVYDYASSAESDTASIDYLSEGEEEVLEVRTKKVGLKPRKKATRMFGEKFLTMIFNGLPRDDFNDGNDPKNRCPRYDRRVIGLDGCFLKTICKGELLLVVDRDGIVNGKGLTIISDQHKSIDNVQDTYMLTSERSSLVCSLETCFGKVVRSRGRGDVSKSKMYHDGIRPIRYGVSWDPVDGETMLGNSMGLPRAAWPARITPEDVIIHAQQTQADAIMLLSGSQPFPSQEEEEHSEGEEQEQIDDQDQMEEEEPVQKRTSKRLKMKTFGWKLTSGPGLTDDDAISVD
uniref:Tetratricopeptide-like helical domain, DYW domain protein n=1 Tax=Tanacetum cinerariifolium TaxID=118510 RepID=A0A6L2L671_TANCI|nr:tetratricopeptide-like helical domain, DYW domain protein [Tanacetum cinerariifolium]